MTDEKTGRLDAFARQIAEQRPNAPQLAQVEQTLVHRFGELAPDGVDQHAAGAAWLIAGNLLSALADQPATVVLDVLRLAGQRLYAGDDVRQSMPCPHVYESGAKCRHVAKGTSAEQLHASMAGHYATYHSAETWPPEPEFDANGRRTAPAKCAGCSRHARPFVAYTDGRTLCSSCCLDRGLTTVDQVREFENHPDAAPMPETHLPPEDARGIIGTCRNCGRPIYWVGDEGEITGRLTTDGAYCEPCYTAESALPEGGE